MKQNCQNFISQLEIAKRINILIVNILLSNPSSKIEYTSKAPDEKNAQFDIIA